MYIYAEACATRSVSMSGYACLFSAATAEKKGAQVYVEDDVMCACTNEFASRFVSYSFTRLQMGFHMCI